MKNQYFGDVNDYRKYALIRILCGMGDFRTSVCWMLTDKDSSGDGRKLSYLSAPEKWRGYDPELFDILRECVQSDRHVARAERHTIIPGASYYTKMLTDNPEERSDYFAGFFRGSKGADIIFFDPDNGIEVPSVQRGNRGSCKYIYWNELQEAYKQNVSLVIYQHFPRVERRAYATRLCDSVRRNLSVDHCLLFKTPTVLFLLAPARRHGKHFQKANNAVRQRAERLIEVWDER